MSKLTRRKFLKVGGLAGTGLVLAACSDRGTSITVTPETASPFNNTTTSSITTAVTTVPATSAPVSTTLPPTARPLNQGTSFMPNVWLKVAPDNSITIIVSKSEMGQGVRTTMAMLVAEELEVEWSKVKVEQAPAGSGYGSQSTGGSTSTRQLWQTLRFAGATAREMLITAAARNWGAGREKLKAENGFVIDPANGNRASYGELSNLASQVQVPASGGLRLKEPGEFKIIGTRQTRVDLTDIITGKAVYGLDVRVPDMLYGVVARSPVRGGKLKSYDDAATKLVPGVKHVIKLDSGVAVVAENTWAALKGRDALKITWDEGQNSRLDTAAIREQLRNKIGVVREVPSGSPNKLDVIYEVPYLAHAPMEPMNCVADIRPNRAEIWAPTQDPGSIQRDVAAITRVPVAEIKVNVTLMGGGFGRRSENDFAIEAINVSRAIGAPVKMMWTRADDIKHDLYRPPSLHVMRAGLDNDGRVTGFIHRVVTPGLTGSGTGQALSGAIPPYNLPAPSVDSISVNLTVPTMWWRSVFHSQNIFATESFIDEMARAANKDPYKYRRDLIKDTRLKAVLDLAAEKGNWGQTLPERQGRGIACFSGYNSYSAIVVDVAVSPEGETKVTKVVCVVDCGIPINPSVIESQMEGSISDGIATALMAEITFKDGKVLQSSFADYQWTRMRDMPPVEIHIIPGKESPGGIGEVGYPPVSPAIANAIHSATGKRVRRLPIRPTDLK
jgi:isoquinoline 1-oxidoreductase beta subunit